VAADELAGADPRNPRSRPAVFSGTLSRAVIVGNDKGILAGRSSAQFFDLENDPGEISDGGGLDPEKTSLLRKLFREHRKHSLELFKMYGSSSETGEVVLNERERERLKAFGYLE